MKKNKKQTKEDDVFESLRAESRRISDESRKYVQMLKDQAEAQARVLSKIQEHQRLASPKSRGEKIIAEMEYLRQLHNCPPSARLIMSPERIECLWTLPIN